MSLTGFLLLVLLLLVPWLRFDLMNAYKEEKREEMRKEQMNESREVKRARKED